MKPSSLVACCLAWLSFARGDTTLPSSACRKQAVSQVSLLIHEECADVGSPCIVPPGPCDVDSIVAGEEWVLKVGMSNGIAIDGVLMDVVGDGGYSMLYRRTSQNFHTSSQTYEQRAWFSYSLPALPADHYQLTLEVRMRKQDHVVATAFYHEDFTFVHDAPRHQVISGRPRIIPVLNGRSNSKEIRCQLFQAADHALIFSFSLPHIAMQLHRVFSFSFIILNGQEQVLSIEMSSILTRREESHSFLNVTVGQLTGGVYNVKSTLTHEHLRVDASHSFSLYTDHQLAGQESLREHDEKMLVMVNKQSADVPKILANIVSERISRILDDEKILAIHGSKRILTNMLVSQVFFSARGSPLMLLSFRAQDVCKNEDESEELSHSLCSESPFLHLDDSLAETTALKLNMIWSSVQDNILLDLDESIAADTTWSFGVHLQLSSAISIKQLNWKVLHVQSLDVHMQGSEKYNATDLGVKVVEFKRDMEGLPPGRYALQVEAAVVLNLMNNEALGLHVALQDQFIADRSANCVEIPLTDDGAILGEELCKNNQNKSTRQLCEDVTFVTSATIDRLPTLLNLLAHWSRPVSVAIYARTFEEERQIRLFVMQYVLPWCSVKSQRISISMLTACIDVRRPPFNLPFPVNKLRRLATLIAKTDLVIYADIDLLPSAELGDVIMEAFVCKKVQAWKDVLVIPSFRSSDKSWPAPARIRESDNTVWFEAEPIVADSLLERFLNGTASIPGLQALELPRGGLWFHSSVFHAPTDYARWFSSSSLYQVDYVVGYEPYLVLNRSEWQGRHGWGLWDDAFDTWGWDKASFAFEVAYAGYSFLVSQHGFLLHAAGMAYRFPRLPNFASTCSRTRADGWGPPDTVGRQRFFDLVQRERAPGWEWMIKSCLILPFLVDCEHKNPSLRLHVRLLRQHVNGSQSLIHSWSFAGLTHHVGYLAQLEILEPVSEEETVLQQQVVFDAFISKQRMLQFVVPQEKIDLAAVRVILKDLHASELLGHESILESFEHVITP
eukprot:760098-Hanusia_phi.AAC.1